MKKSLLFLFFLIILYSSKLISNEYFILSIDGGGSRGVIPAAILKNLEADIGGRCAQAFDCISGTSTGSLIAAALAMPDPDNLFQSKYLAKDILDMYIEEIPNIFANSFYYSIKSLWGWFGPKYQKVYFENFLKDKFKEFKIKDSLTDLIITSFDLIRERGFYFENFKDLDLPNLDFPLKNDYLVSDAILASTAAPSYFSPEIIKDDNTQYILIDGGMIANDPSALAIRECIKNKKFNNTKVYILSLGCGRVKSEKIDTKQIENWGLIEFLPELIESLFDSIQVDTIEELECLKKLMDLTYLRININIDPDENLIDITDKNVLKDLSDKAEYFYKNDFKNSKDGQNLIELLKRKIQKTKELSSDIL